MTLQKLPLMEMRLLVGDHVGLDVAEGRVGLVLDAVVEGLDDVFLEVRRAREALSRRPRAPRREYSL